METQKIILEKNVPCTMRDGTVLYADIYRPAKDGRFPVLLTRLPYSKDSPLFSHRYLDTNRIVQNDFVVIIQDVRGRYQSEGDFYPTLNEGRDGYDTVEWAAKLPYSSGKVGMFGLSYYGFTQLLAAKEQPPHLHAIAPVMTLHDWVNNLTFKDGKFHLANTENWMLESAAPDLIKRKYQNKDEYRKKMRQWAEFMGEINKWFKYMPVSNWPPLRELGVAEFFYDFIEGNLVDSKLNEMRVSDAFDQIQVPALHIAGWYDSFLESTLENFIQMRKQTTQPQKLMIGPWGHGVFTSRLGDRNFGVHASEDWIDFSTDLTQIHIDWFNYWLKGEKSSFIDDAVVKLFVMGKNEWRDETDWPLERAEKVNFYLHSRGNANSRFGDGVLSTTPPIDEPADTYIYDPLNPVPTNGGSIMAVGEPIGPIDQSKLEERKDILVYTSEALTEELEVTGEIKAVLWAKTDVVDTDFTVKLVDVAPNGTAFNISEGIVRTSNQYPNGNIKNQVNKYEVKLNPTSIVFLPGHRIRIEISSSNFPQFDVNLNTGKTMIESAESTKAHQTIYHQKEFSSYIQLPVIK